MKTLKLPTASKDPRALLNDIAANEAPRASAGRPRLYNYGDYKSEIVKMRRRKFPWSQIHEALIAAGIKSTPVALIAWKNKQKIK